ncbi:cutinase transcription factor 1 alpha [Ilyonectria destructans]|nr:cutinase transcription factor 1 alpha [Ilyonectria destructans]
MQTRGKTRARQACQSCNARRIKCNLVDENPCTNCALNNTPCVPRISRRGKHPRKPKAPSSSALHPQHQGSETALSASGQETRPSLPDEGASSCSPSLSATQSVEDGPGPLFSATAPQPPIVRSPRAEATPAVSKTPVPGGAWDDHIAASQVLAGLSQNEIAGQAWLLDASERRTTDGISGSPSHTYSCQNTCPPPSASRQDDEGAVFLGESASIRYLHDTDPSPTQPSPMERRSMYLVPEGVRAQNLTSEWEAERAQAKIKLLEAEGAFSFPPDAAIKMLLKVYFKWFHSCFAIVDEPDVWEQYEQGTISPLLLQSVLFIGVMHCHQNELQCVGLGSRNRAKYILYNRAKDLYDAGIESRALTVIQALFLMSFWRAGALLQKDTRHWLGAAVSLAETKGLHRASSQGAGSKLQRLRKRMWWSLYIRERQCAAALGLPNRIRDEDCDVEALNNADFEETFDPTISPMQSQEFICYMVEMSVLSRMLGRIIHQDFIPSKRLTTTGRHAIKEVITSWRTSLPACMQPATDGLDNHLGFHGSMLHLACNNLLILLYRSSCGSPSTEEDSALGAQIGQQAAARNTTIIENMIANSTLRHAQIHVITNIFNTLCIHTLALRNSEGTQRYLVEHRAKLCLLGLRELQKTWEVKNWILQLFFQYLDQSTAARLEIGEETGEPDAAPRQTSDSRGATANVEGGFLEEMHNTTLHGTDLSPGFEMPWLRSTEDVGQFLYSQIENRFVNSDRIVLMTAAFVCS